MTYTKSNMPIIIAAIILFVLSKIPMYFSWFNFLR
jgi:uncharacterized protein (DUF486 family)